MISTRNAKLRERNVKTTESPPILANGRETGGKFAARREAGAITFVSNNNLGNWWNASLIATTANAKSSYSCRVAFHLSFLFIRFSFCLFISFFAPLPRSHGCCCYVIVRNENKSSRRRGRKSGGGGGGRSRNSVFDRLRENTGVITSER